MADRSSLEIEIEVEIDRDIAWGNALTHEIMRWLREWRICYRGTWPP